MTLNQGHTGALRVEAGPHASLGPGSPAVPAGTPPSVTAAAQGPSGSQPQGLQSSPPPGAKG